MSVLYKPVLIETVEQIKDMPVGTVILGTNSDWVLELSDEGFWANDGAHLAHEDVIGRTVLVPVRAEEEKRDHPTIMLPTYPPKYPQQTRLVTPWEEVSDRP